MDQIVGYAWKQIGVNRVRVEATPIRLSEPEGSTQQDGKSDRTFNREADPETKRWMEASADAWLARTQVKLAAWDLPTLVGRAPMPLKTAPVADLDVDELLRLLDAA